jgi:hypothetical protein
MNNNRAHITWCLDGVSICGGRVVDIFGFLISHDDQSSANIALGLIHCDVSVFVPIMKYLIIWICDWY